MHTSAPRRAPRRFASRIGLAALAIGFWVLAQSPAAAEESFLGRPIYSEPASGLQLPPGCQVDPSWRSQVSGSDLEIWVALCAGRSRVWLLKRQVIEVISSRQSRLRFEVLDERIFPEERAGESLSVQCTGPRDEPGYVVRGAVWRGDGKELRLKGARGVLHPDTRAQKLQDTEVGAVDCVRFPEREVLMRRLQNHN